MRNLTVPPHTFGALYRYYKHGYEPGGFLTYIIINDAWSAAAIADEDNFPNLASIILFNGKASAFQEDCKTNKDFSGFDLKWEAWRIRFSPSAEEIALDFGDPNDD